MKFKHLLVFCLLFAFPFFAEAKGYDYYVSASASGDEDGSQEKPFAKIGDAIGEANKKGGGKSIFIGKGKYEESFSSGKSMKLYGKDEKDVKIVGTVTLKDGSRLENITVDGGNYAVVVEKNADAEIKNCTIEDFGKIGINAEMGGGTLVVTGSTIKNGTGKGFYIQKGKEISLIGNEVYGNGEEGIDIRSNINGTIKNNLIQGNGESGIELVIGKADLRIYNNNIKNNGSSGIATQFYEELDDDGDVYVESNNLSGNKNYGLDCKIPQGGGFRRSYWSDAIKMLNNDVENNKKGAISALCGAIDLMDGKEEISPDISNDNLTEKTLEEKKAEEEALRLQEEEKNRRIEEFERILLDQNKPLDDLDTAIRKIESKDKFKVFLFGFNRDEIEKSLIALGEVERNVFQVRDSLDETLIGQEKTNSFKSEIDLKVIEIEQKRNILNQKKNHFFLIGWFISLKDVF